MTLIDKDALRMSVREISSVGGCSAIDRDELEDAISDAPIIDAVEVIRCGECKFSSICLMRNPNEACNEPYKDNDFCSYGHKKDVM